MPVAALVIGIVGLILSLVPCLGMYALPLTILGAIFGVLGMKKEKGKGMAIAGLVCGIIGTLIATYWIYIYMTFKAQVEDPNSEFNRGVPQIEKDFDEAAKEIEREMNKETPDPVEPPAPEPAPDPAE